MRKESQHYQTEQCPPITISPQCQETTKNFTRTHQIKSKHDLLDWLRSLPFEIRYLAVKVEAPGLAHAIRDTLRRINSKMESHQAKKSNQKFQKNILDSLVFTSDGRQFFDSICFDFSFIELPEKLYQLLMYSADNTKKFNPIEDMEKNRLSIKQSCKQIFSSKTKDQLCKNLVRILRHQVFFNICHKQCIKINDQKNRKKQFSFYWKTLPQQLKLNLLNLKYASLKDLFSFLNQQNISLSIEQIEKQIALLIKLQKNQFCNRIFKCKLKKSLSFLTDYHQLIYQLWKSEHEKAKKRKNRRTTQTSMLKNQLCAHKKQQQKNFKYQQKKQMNENERKKQMHEQKQQKNEYKRQKLEQKQMDSITIQKQWSINSFDTNQTQIYQKQQHSQLKHQFFKQSFLHTFIEKTINSNIVQFSQHISKQANTFYNARLIAFERISFIMKFYGINIKIFGSCASGIAVKNSDIDIAVDYAITNFYNGCNQNDKVKLPLQWLETVFTSFTCMKNIRFIKGATIPLLKLTVDTSQLFELNQNFFNFDVSQYVQYLSRPHKHGLIEIDISIETQIETHSQTFVCNHLGLNTTRTINRWFQQIKPLKFIIIIMKYFLDLQQLNNTYEQGINTYGVIVMFVAVIKHLKLQKEIHVGKIWQKVLRFIVYQFDQKVYGIDLRNKQQLFFKKSQQSHKNQFTKADLEVLDPENQGYNMTRKCYKYQLIKDLFQKIEKRCFSDIRKKIISSFLKDKKLSFANIRDQNNLKKQSLDEIAKTMQNPFMQLLRQIKPEFSLISGSFTQNKSSYESLDQFSENMTLLRTQSIAN